MAIILPANTLAAGGYDVANSCRFNGDAYLHKTVGTPTNADKYTLSVWVKRSILTSFGPDNAQYIMSYDGGGNPREHIRFTDSTDTLDWYFRDSGGTATNLTTTQEFRDVSAWYHFVFVYDSGQAVAANRQKIYCNGAEITSFSSSGYVAQNTDSNLNSNVSVKIGAIGTGSPSVYSSQYLSEVVFLDGQTLAASNFGEYDEDSPTIWKPKDVSGLTFGDNGFYLDFEDSSNLGNDANGGTDWTEVSLAATDSSTDTCTNNFNIMLPIMKQASNLTFSEGNLAVAWPSAATWRTIYSSIMPTAGKWYWEVKRTASADCFTGIVGEAGVDNSDDSSISAPATAYSMKEDGNLYTGGVAKSGGVSTTTNDIIGIAMDLDNGTLWFSKNGVWTNSATQAEVAAGTTTNAAYSSITVGAGYPYGPASTGKESASFSFNFGSPPYAISSGNADGNGYGNFEYAVPGNFYSLCTKNLAEFG